jgi:IS30 family transposase
LANKKAGFSVPQIAEELGRNKSTIYRELEPNAGDRGYRPKQANHKARQRKSESTKSIKMTAELIDLIEEKLYLDWSPEQVSGWLIIEKKVRISHERIYQHV